MNLREQYDKIIDAYIDEFEQKNDCELEFWISDDKTGIASFGDTWFIHVSDIIYDVDNSCPYQLIFDWLDDSLEAHYQKLPTMVNYSSYVKGVRFDLKPLAPDTFKQDSEEAADDHENPEP